MGGMEKGLLLISGEIVVLVGRAGLWAAAFAAWMLLVIAWCALVFAFSGRLPWFVRKYV